jgi:hypothetical protein
MTETITFALPVQREPVVRDAQWRKVHSRIFRFASADAATYRAIQAAYGLANAQAYAVRAIRPVPCELTPAGMQASYLVGGEADQVRQA